MVLDRKIVFDSTGRPRGEVPAGGPAAVDYPFTVGTRPRDPGRPEQGSNTSTLEAQMAGISATFERLLREQRDAAAVQFKALQDANDKRIADARRQADIEKRRRESELLFRQRRDSGAQKVRGSGVATPGAASPSILGESLLGGGAGATLLGG